MTFRSLIGLVLIFALVTAAVFVAQLNGSPTTVQLPGLGTFTAPLWTVLLLTLLSGVFLALVYSLALTSREALHRWRGEKERQVAEEVRSRFLTASLQLQTGDAEAALSQFEEVCAREPHNAEAWLLGGIAARRAGDTERATSMHVRAQGLLPEDERVAEELSRDAEAAGDLPQAIRQLQQLPETAARLERLRDLLERVERHDEAIDAQRRLAQEPGDAVTREQRRALLHGLQLQAASRALEAGHHDEAAALASELTATDSELAAAHAILAAAREAAGDRAAALDTLKAGFAATESLELLRRAANLHVDLEQPEEAIGLLREAASRMAGEKSLAARALLGRLYYRLELIDEARAEFESLSEELEHSAVVDYYLAKILARQGEHERAARLLKDTVRDGGFLELRYRCPECGGASRVFGARCSARCAMGAVELDLSRDLQPAVAVEPPAV